MSLSQSPRKQSGFTLIELMVVMAIIAILATAGLSAYTGYIKKARDATRIADVAAIKTIILGGLDINGKPPQTSVAVHDLIVAANNGKGIFDPLSNQTTGTSPKLVCNNTFECLYGYRLCDGGMGFAVSASFESASNFPLQASDDIGPSDMSTLAYDNHVFEVGECKVACGSGTSGCPSGQYLNETPMVIAPTGLTYYVPFFI